MIVFCGPGAAEFVLPAGHQAQSISWCFRLLLPQSPRQSLPGVFQITRLRSEGQVGGNSLVVESCFRLCVVWQEHSILLIGHHCVQRRAASHKCLPHLGVGVNPVALTGAWSMHGNAASGIAKLQY